MLPDLRQFLIAYAGSGLFLLVADVLWLMLAMGPLYKSALGERMRTDVAMLPAALFYLLFVVGIVIFVVVPVFRNASVAGYGTVALLGALLGLIAYGTYDLTNLATLRDWPVRLAVIDMAWGTLVTGGASVVGLYALRRFG